MYTRWPMLSSWLQEGGSSRVLAYARMVIRNKMVNHYRRARRVDLHYGVVPDDLVGYANAEASAEWLDLLRLINTLPERQRQLLVAATVRSHLRARSAHLG